MERRSHVSQQGARRADSGHSIGPPGVRTFPVGRSADGRPGSSVCLVVALVLLQCLS